MAPLRSGPSRLALAALLAAVVAPELGSESVSLPTYYPSPGGVYRRMNTSDATYLASTTGNVGIGIALTSALSHRLVVAGPIQIGGAFSGAGDGVDRPAANSLAVRIAGTQRLTVDANKTDVNASLAARHAGCVVTDQQPAYTSGPGTEASTFTPSSYCNGASGGSAAPPAANTWYVTYLTGVMSNYQGGVQRIAASNNKFLCCPCPAGGCNYW